MSTTWNDQNTAGEQFMAPGWYIDPADTGVMRRWDGHGWTADTVAAPPQPVYTRPPNRSGAAGWASTLFRSNSTSLIAVLVCALYLVIDRYTGFVIFGVIPISLSITAIRRREPLWIIAVVATILAVAAPFVLFER
jgi:hypothetical protein